MQKTIIFTLIILGTIAITNMMPAYAQTASPEPVPAQVHLGNISGAVVTLYYYDEATGEKGEKVRLPDNPQYVQWDEQAAAPGTYTFSRVPEGTYYIEAVHNNNSWFAIANVNRGTTTANVAIPPVNWTQEPTVAPSVTPAITPAPTATPVQGTSTPQPVRQATPTPAPGMEGLAALAGIGIIACYVMRKK